MVSQHPEPKSSPRTAEEIAQDIASGSYDGFLARLVGSLQFDIEQAAWGFRYLLDKTPVTDRNYQLIKQFSNQADRAQEYSKRAIEIRLMSW